MMYLEDEYLMISGIQHFVFCRRQWALIHIEQQWSENFQTIDGKIMHKNVHNDDFNETRGDLIITRGMAVASSELGMSGECDVVEFKKDSDGVTLFGRDGTYSVTPIEYKRGRPKVNESDIMQLAVQAMCLEEMLCCNIDVGYLFYGEIRRRIRVEFTDELRHRVVSVIQEMHRLYSEKHTPMVKKSKACASCSLQNICLPVICSKQSVLSYIDKMLNCNSED